MLRVSSHHSIPNTKIILADNIHGIRDCHFIELGHVLFFDGGDEGQEGDTDPGIVQEEIGLANISVG